MKPTTTTENARITALPVDPRSAEDLDFAIIARQTAAHRRPQGRTLLRPVQALALQIIEEVQGGLLSIGVGHGKTLIALLAHRVLEARRPVIVVRSANRATAYEEITKWKHQFEVDIDPALITYDDISHQYGILDKMRPDAVIADECHGLKDPTTSRTRQFLRYFKEHPDTKFVGMTGTVFSKSLRDVAHLARLALGTGSPIPWDTDRTYLHSWARACDPPNSRSWPAESDWARIHPLLRWGGYTDGLRALRTEPVEHRRTLARAAFFRRFSTAPGVVHTVLPAIDTAIRVELVEDLEGPIAVQDAISEASSAALLPCGAEVEDAMDLARKLRELSAGFYYVWDWPDGEPDREWLHARSGLNKAIGRVFRLRRRGLDTRAQILRALDRGDFDHWQSAREALDEWNEHRHKPAPPKRTHWVSDYLVDDLAIRAVSGPPALIFCRSEALLERLAEKGFPVCRPGEDPLAHAGRSVAVSLQSHGTGLNLQPWPREIFPDPPSGGGVFEQAIGRVHRLGQEAARVDVEIYAHTIPYRKAVANAREEARFAEQVQGQRQKLTLAEWRCSGAFEEELWDAEAALLPDFDEWSDHS